MLGIAAAAVLLGVAGFLVSVVTAGDRARDVALLDALGTPPGRVTGLLCLEQAVAAALAIAAGLALGAVLSRLIRGITTIVATHDRTLISAADRVLTLQDGLLAPLTP